MLGLAAPTEEPSAPRYLQLRSLGLQRGGVLLQEGALLLQGQDLTAEGHILSLQVLQLLLQQLPLGLKSCILGEKHAPVTHSVPALSGHGTLCASTPQATFRTPFVSFSVEYLKSTFL